MSIIDVAKLLAPVDGESPVGSDLSYDPSMMEIDQLAAGKPEQQVGDTIVAAEDPDWKELRSRCTETLAKSKDLRVAMHLLVAAVKMDGMKGLCDGLALIRGMLENYWDKFYPQLDPEDGNDPLLRMNIISTLTDPINFRRRLREAPLTMSAMLGKFGLKDIEIATGEIPAPDDPNFTKIEMKTIDAAFEDSPVEFLQENAAAVDTAIEHVKAIDAFLTRTVGAGKAINFKELEAVLKKAKSQTANYLAKRGIGSAEPGGDGAGAAVGGGGGGGGAAVSGDVRTPQDVIKLIDKICAYYERNEPSSPIPLLLKRAQRLVSKNFLEVIKELTPDTLKAIESLGGIQSQQ
ncbi:MAG TPA: type VI secretion system protein TssA [Tepidisphaeraceae bacterium]|jgi:type VI secretion system protein ImpA|nr:type VI secretion system protein TssA [Tepidisphaeraceae bacterium]